MIIQQWNKKEEALSQVLSILSTNKNVQQIQILQDVSYKMWGMVYEKNHIILLVQVFSLVSLLILRMIWIFVESSVPFSSPCTNQSILEWSYGLYSLAL